MIEATEMALHEQLKDRLSLIENQMTRLSDAVVSIARMEERVVAVLEVMERQSLAIEAEKEERVALENRLVILEKESVSTQVLKKFMWVLGTALIPAILGLTGYAVLHSS